MQCPKAVEDVSSKEFWFRMKCVVLSTACGSLQEDLNKRSLCAARCMEHKQHLVNDVAPISHFSRKNLRPACPFISPSIWNVRNNEAPPSILPDHEKHAAFTIAANTSQLNRELSKPPSHHGTLPMDVVDVYVSTRASVESSVSRSVRQYGWAVGRRRGARRVAGVTRRSTGRRQRRPANSADNESAKARSGDCSVSGNR